MISFCVYPGYSKKIKTSFKIEKDSKPVVNKNEILTGREIDLSDTIRNSEIDKILFEQLNKIVFAGFDKEGNSSKESFLLVNPTDHYIRGYEVIIDYLDMQERMLHSRIIKEKCEVPPGETRRYDFKSWDTQHTYYYYLGNEPKRIATPFKVKITPIKFWID